MALTEGRANAEALVAINDMVPRTVEETEAFDQWLNDPDQIDDGARQLITEYFGRAWGEAKKIRTVTKPEATGWVKGLLHIGTQVEESLIASLAAIKNKFIKLWDAMEDCEKMSPEAQALWTYLSMHGIASAIETEQDEDANLLDTVKLATACEGIDSKIIDLVQRIAADSDAAAALVDTRWLDESLRDKMPGNDKTPNKVGADDCNKVPDTILPTLPRGIVRPSADDIETFKAATQDEMFATKTGKSECLDNTDEDFVAMTAVALHYWKDEPEQWSPFVRQYRFSKKKGLTGHKTWRGLTKLDGIDAIASCFKEADKTRRNRRDAWNDARRKKQTIVPSHNTLRWIDIQGKVILAKAISRGNKVSEVEGKLKETGMSATLDKDFQAKDFPDFDPETAKWIVNALTYAEGAQDPVPEEVRLKISESMMHPMATPKKKPPRDNKGKRKDDKQKRAIDDAALRADVAAAAAVTAKNKADLAETVQNIDAKKQAAKAAETESNRAATVADDVKKFVAAGGDRARDSASAAEASAKDAARQAARASAAVAAAEAEAADPKLRPRSQHGIGYKMALAVPDARLAASERLWQFSKLDMANIINCPDEERDLKERLVAWATEVWSVVKSPEGIDDMKNRLLSLERNAGHVREKHSVPWALKYLRRKLEEDVCVSDITTAIYRYVAVLLIRINLTVRLGCGRGTAEVSDGLPWYEILDEDYPQHERTRWYAIQMEKNRQHFLQQIEEGKFLVNVVRRDKKRQRESSDLEKALDDSNEAYRDLVRNLVMRLEFKKMQRELKEREADK
ncbi:hypothetical protein RB595_008311 [Gaeumannomyces hyphopodioides]